MNIIKINFYDKTFELTPHFFLYDVEDFIGRKMIIPGIKLTEKTKNSEEPFAILTKSFGEFISIKNSAYIDTNNCPFADVFLKIGLATDTRLSKQSCFCEYPLWKFDEKFLKEIGGIEYEKYCRAFETYMHGDIVPSIPQLV